MSANNSGIPQALTMGEGLIYGKFIEIELNGLNDSFSLTKLDGASFNVSKTLQAGGSGVQINVAEAWVNGESLLLVLDSADTDFPSNWSAATLQASNFNVSTSDHPFVSGTSTYSIAATTPPLSLDEVLSFSGGSAPSFSQGMPFSDNSSLLKSSIDDDAVLDALFANPNIGGSDLYLTMGTTTTLEFVELAQDETTGRDSFSLSGNDLTPSFEAFVIANNTSATDVLVVREQDISFPASISGGSGNDTITLDTLATALTDVYKGAEPTAINNLATTLKGWNPTWMGELTFGVTADSDSDGDTVTFATTANHGLQTRDALIVLYGSWDVPASIGGIANGEVLAIKQAFSGVHEVTWVSDTSFTIEVDHDFSSNIVSSTTFSSLNFSDVKAGLNLDRLQEDLAWDLIDEINDINLSGTSFTGGVAESIKAYTEGGTSAISLPNLYEFNVSFANSSKANVYASGSTTETQEIVFSEFGLDRIFSGVTGFATAGESGLTGSLLAPTSITGAGSDDRIFAGGGYMADGGYSPQSVSGGGGNDTLVLLGQASDYAVVKATLETGLTPSSATMSLGATAADPDTVTLTTSTSVPNLNTGDWVQWTPTMGSVGGVDFTVAPAPAFLQVTDVQPSGGGASISFTFDVSRFNFTDATDVYTTDFTGLQVWDAIPVTGVSYAFDSSLGAAGFDVVGLASNSYSGTSALLSTVIASTRLDVTGVEKIEFAQWPLDAPLPAYDLPDLGYLPLEPIHITAFNATQTTLSSAFDISTRLLDLSALSGTNIEVDATIDLDGLGTGYVYYETGAGAEIQRHEVEIGDFSGYIISGSNTAVFGRDDYSELVVVKGGGENLFIELNNSPDLFGLDVLAFTNQTDGITINLSLEDAETGAVTFTNDLAGVPEAVSGSVFGARGVIGSNQDDVITGSNQASLLSGGGGNDTVTGGTGNDFIMVGGVSSAVGGAGEDTLVSWGSSELTGGTGNDVFFVSGDSSFTKDAQTGVFTASTTNSTHITDFDFAEDGASRPGRSSSWDERVGITLSLSALVGLGVLPNTTAEGESLSPTDWSALRSKLDFEVTEIDLDGAGGNDAIRVDVTYDYIAAPATGTPTAETITLASFTAARAPVAGETINATMIADEYRDLEGSVFGVPGVFDMFDLVTTYKGLDSNVLTDDIDDPAPGITAGGPDSAYAIADDRVVIYIGMEKNDVSVVRSDFPPTTAPGETIALFARKGASGDLESKFEGSNANERFVGGKAADEYRFIAETFYDDDKTVSNEQSFGRDLIIERGSFTADANRDAIVVRDLQINDAVFNRTEISREGAGQSLEISWDDVPGTNGVNAGDVSVLRQYSWTTQRFRVEDIVLADGGVEKTYDLGVTKARGAELHTSDARDAILVGRDNGADTFVVNAGAANGQQDFDLHLWGLDESDTLRFEGMGALTSFVAQGSARNGDYIEHSAVLTFVGVDDINPETTDDSWTVNATFHQDFDATPRDFDFMTLVVDPDGKVDGADNGSNGTYPVNLDAKNLILFDDTGDAAGLYEFDLDRQEAMQEAGLSFDGETIDIYLLDDGTSSDNNVNLIGFMGETTDEDSGTETDFVYEEIEDEVYDDDSTLTASSITVVDDADGTVATASATLKNTSTEVDITTDSAETGGTAIAILNFVDEKLEFVSFSDTDSSFSELDLSTVAA